MDSPCADWTQTITIIIAILVPMLAGFGWILHQMSELKTRVAIIETILNMMGAKFPSKEKAER